MNRSADFRSDTVTLPSPAMLAAMMAAELGDDVLDGDPTVRALEERVAQWSGKEGAIFVPSGTMANQVALGAWTRPGDEIVTEKNAHIVCWEGGALGSLHGVQALTLEAVRGDLDPAQVRAAIRMDDVHCPRTALITVEQTFMGAGFGPSGCVVPLPRLQAIRSVASEAGIPVHMDGARLANAVVASGIPADEWARTADSVSICLSKGLGAPVGSVLAGDRAFLERGRVIRKRLGGWMRQAGLLAAAGLYALEHNVERLAEDHALARSLAERIRGFPGLDCSLADVETNIVMSTVADAAALSATLERAGVRALPMSPTALRFVTHMDVGAEDVDRAVSALKAALT